MEVIFSKDVDASLDEYRESLCSYPISRGRVHQKFDRMVDSLVSLGTSILLPPICTNKDLLQTFDENGIPLNKNLRRHNYKDESGFQWSFACLYDEDEDTITILKMMAAIHIRESMRELISRIINETLNEYLNKNVLFS